MSPKDLLEASRRAAENAYAPYSKFRVGAALLCSDDTILTGTNVENRSFGLSNCAERTAFFSAITAGKRAFKALALTCLDAAEPVSPCGACRQVISEFVQKDFPIYYQDGKGNLVSTTLEQLLPRDALHDLASKMNP